MPRAFTDNPACSFDPVASSTVPVDLKLILFPESFIKEPAPPV